MTHVSVDITSASVIIRATGFVTSEIGNLPTTIAVSPADVSAHCIKFVPVPPSGGDISDGGFTVSS